MRPIDLNQILDFLQDNWPVIIAGLIAVGILGWVFLFTLRNAILNLAQAKDRETHLHAVVFLYDHGDENMKTSAMEEVSAIAGAKKKKDARKSA